ncbi:MAG: galactokinase, partial [Clostridia bacterium]|nr:galactokinase [Clostridia bacterium]
MYNPTTLKKAVLENEAIFAELYGKDNVKSQQERYIKAIDRFVEIYGEKDEMYIFSAPGRTEISGNHTDHNHGCVMAGSVNLDVIAIAAPTKDGIIRVQSEGYREIVVDLNDLEPKKEEYGTSTALVRGVARALKDRGYSFGGFTSYYTSDILKGAGVSSSAA